MKGSVDSRAGSYAGQTLVIVATGPSYDDVPKEVYDGLTIFALNFSITEFKRHADCWWICHDLWTCLPRYRMRERLKDYAPWNLVTRRCYLPGNSGRVDWRQKGGERVRRAFNWRLKKWPLNSEIVWYNEFSDQQGYMRNGDTVLELALEVATCWGFSDIWIVGADMQKINGRAYANPWASWKPCKITKQKFVEMRAALTRHRPRWSARIRTVSPHWNGAFEPATVKELSALSSQKEVAS